MTYSTPVRSGLRRFRGKWDDAAARHLLRRATFGASPADVTAFASGSFRKSLDRLLDFSEASPSTPVNNYNDAMYTDPEIPMGQTWVTATKYDGMSNGRRRNSFKSWWMEQIITQQPTLREKMVLFWHNHFSTETRTIDNALYCYRNNALLRQYALGNFRQLTSAVTKDTGMLRYLNGQTNTKQAPDENYGRELQELFTVGKGPGSHYQESDVKAAAHVLTGYYIDGKNFQYAFGPGRHDDSDKQFSEFYGNYVVKGQKGKDGEKELEDMLDMIFRNDEVARFICRKLYRFFVYHDIDADTDKNVIEPLAKTFRKNNYEIAPVLRELLESEHFFDAANRNALIKTPLDLTAGLCREYSVRFPDDPPARYNLFLQLQVQASNMQLNIGDPPNVAGWPAWYEAPQFDKMWINSDTLPKRNVYSDRMVANGFSKDQNKVLADVIAFAEKTPDPSNADVLIDSSLGMLFNATLPEKSHQYIKSSILLNGLQPDVSDHYWTQAWNALKERPDDLANRNNVTAKLKSLYKYIMHLPQYQLC